MNIVGLGSISNIISHINLGKNIVDYLKNSFKPDLVLLVDYGGFNLRLAKALKENNIEVFYYISPQVWASRKSRLNSIKKYISKMMLILPFEEKIHKSAGINAEYVGHPLVSQIDKNFDKQDFIKANNLDPHKKIIGIFPGSRKMEINYILPVFLKAARIIYSRSKKVQFCLAQAANVSENLINKYLKKHDKDNDLDIRIIKDQNHALLASSDVLMLKSGTVTFEAALYNTPMIVSYKGPFAFYCIYLLLRYIKFAALPNIIAQKSIVKEFLQYDARPELIANEVCSLLHNPERRQEMMNELAKIREQLGDKIASKEVARIINEQLTR